MTDKIEVACYLCMLHYSPLREVREDRCCDGATALIATHEVADMIEGELKASESCKDADNRMLMLAKHLRDAK